MTRTPNTDLTKLKNANISEQVFHLLNVSENNLLENNLSKAENICQQALYLAEEVNDKTLESFCRILYSQILNEKKEYVLAVESAETAL
jgi:hypothetical protein